MVEKALEWELLIGWAEDLEKEGRARIYGIEFATGSAEIRGESARVLRQVAELLGRTPGVRFRVEGHTDATGTAAGNEKLALQRAESVVRWLGENGVDAARLTASGYGAARPVATNDSEEGRGKNRRVEVVKE